ncbi:MAG: MoaD/ThiS family protein [Acidimicrobiia bacterium]
MERRRCRGHHGLCLRDVDRGGRRGDQGRRRGDRNLTVRLRLFARAREAAGRSEDRFDAATVGELLAAARAAYPAEFTAVLEAARVWVNGDEPADGDATALRDGDEVAVIPPVSGGADDQVTLERLAVARPTYRNLSSRALANRSATSGQFTMFQNDSTQSAFTFLNCR